MLHVADAAYPWTAAAASAREMTPLQAVEEELRIIADRRREEVGDIAAGSLDHRHHRRWLRVRPPT